MMIRNRRFTNKAILLLSVFFFSGHVFAQSVHNTSKGLHFTSLPTRWDEAIPLGNGMLGALIYEKDGMLRIALDRADLWDLRPIKSFSSPDFSYQWIYKQVLKQDYGPVQIFLNASDIKNIAPTKIPAGAMKFPIKNLGKIASVDLDIETATCYIQWVDGTKAIFFISGTDPAGYFKFENLPAETNKAFLPCLEPPSYQVSKYDNTGKAIVGGQDLARLGYTKGSIRRSGNFIDYHQQGWENFSYDIALGWKNANKQTLVGAWSMEYYISWITLFFF